MNAFKFMDQILATHAQDVAQQNNNLRTWWHCYTRLLIES
jgi:hypothetical protein